MEVRKEKKCQFVSFLFCCLEVGGKKLDDLEYRVWSIFVIPCLSTDKDGILKTKKENICMCVYFSSCFLLFSPVRREIFYCIDDFDSSRFFLPPLIPKKTPKQWKNPTFSSFSFCSLQISNSQTSCKGWRMIFDKTYNCLCTFKQ